MNNRITIETRVILGQRNIKLRNIWNESKRIVNNYYFYYNNNITIIIIILKYANEMLSNYIL